MQRSSRRKGSRRHGAMRTRRPSRRRCTASAARCSTGATTLARGNTWRRASRYGASGECLHILAGVAAVQGQATRAATLAGAAEAIHESIQAPPSRAERAIRDHFLAASQEKTGETAFAIARMQGYGMGIDGAVEYA